MAIEYLGLSEVNGPLVVLEGVKNASYEEMVEFTIDDHQKKLGRIIAVYEDKAVIQVFEGDRQHVPAEYPHPPDRPSDGAGRFSGNPGTYFRRHRKSHRRSRAGKCGKAAERQRTSSESCDKKISEKLYSHRNFGYRRSDDPDPRPRNFRSFPATACPTTSLQRRLYSRLLSGGDSDEKFAVVFAAMA